MGMKRVYRCDICRDELENPDKSFGLHFKSLNEFTLGGHGCTEGTHICYRCAKQLKTHLNNLEITAQME